MLDRLKKAILSRRHSPEYAEHILRVERAIERVPSGLATEAWCAWLWRLPPQAWLDAVDLRILTHNETLLREAGVRAMVRMNRLANSAPNSPEALDAARAIEVAKKESGQRTLELIDRRKQFVARWGEPPS